MDSSRRILAQNLCHEAQKAMSPGVVDQRLNVYGLEGLKVADLSIAPVNVSATGAMGWSLS